MRRRCSAGTSSANLENTASAWRDGQGASPVDDAEGLATVQRVDQLAICDVGDAQFDFGGAVGGVDGDDDCAGRVAADEGELLARDVKLRVVAAAQSRESKADCNQRFDQAVQFRMGRMLRKSRGVQRRPKRRVGGGALAALDA